MADFELFHINEFTDQAPEKLPFIVDRLITYGSRNMIFGDTGARKSMLAAGLAMSVVRGEPFLGEYACEQGNVLFVQNDMPFDEWQFRLTNMRKYYDTQPDDGFYTLHLSEQMDIERVGDYSAMKQIVAACTPRLLILDLISNTYSIDPQKENEVQRVIKAWTSLLPQSCALVYVLHETKPHDKKVAKHAYSNSHKFLGECSWACRMYDYGTKMLNVKVRNNRTEEGRVFSTQMVAEDVCVLEKSLTAEEFIANLMRKGQSRSDTIKAVVEKGLCKKTKGYEIWDQQAKIMHRRKALPGS